MISQPIRPQMDFESQAPALAFRLITPAARSPSKARGVSAASRTIGRGDAPAWWYLVALWTHRRRGRLGQGVVSHRRPPEDRPANTPLAKAIPHQGQRIGRLGVEAIIAQEGLCRLRWRRRGVACYSGRRPMDD